ncbi:MAG: mechanosensitive ion channel [Alphaproteobacteria bacterium]|nr:mechanosensitive ion channel [Rhodospirillales bacterium]MCW9045891.1 mechanosensitive ion channel [Alphaproteobacteria bacterium]
METIPYWDKIEPYLLALKDWVLTTVIVPSSVVQLVLILGGYLFGRWLAPKLKSLLEKILVVPWIVRYFSQLATSVLELALPIVMAITFWFMATIAEFSSWPHHLITSVVGLLFAWVVIRLMASVVGNASWARVIAMVAWTLAALNLLGLLDNTLVFLESIAFEIGKIRISLLEIGKGVIALAFMLWLASFASRLLENRFKSSKNLSPSVQVLFSKLSRAALFVFAIIMGLQSVGIDLTAFAVFSGAVGLGVGFGLQKIVSNLISGIILLLDKSVKPGDVIAIGQTYGSINSLGARYVSVITRDGTEHLIPNEELISQRVENWSYSNTEVRIKTKIGIAYDSDVNKARELVLQAIASVPRALKHPAPMCHLIDFADNGVLLEARIWINDPQNGVANARSDMLMKVWELFNEHNINFPYPQRDLHIKEAIPLRVSLEKNNEEVSTDSSPQVKNKTV